jgi:hypothetical protein
LGEKPLLAAVDWYLDTYRDTLTKKTVAETYPDFLASIRDEVRPSTIDDYTSSLKAFGEFTDKRSLPEIRGDDVEAFLTKRGLKKKSWNNTRADLHAFFGWAAKAPRKWITSNPVAEVKTISVTRGLPEIISVTTARDLMAFVASYRGEGKEPKPAGFLVPYFGLALFAGIRPAINEGEIIRLGRLKDPSPFIDLKNKVIRITPEIAKTKDVRQVTIQPNFGAWLKAYPLDRFPVTPPNLFDEVALVRKKFELGHDVLRHTFITMHVTKFRSMGDTALQSGNSEKMIKKHYLNIANPDDATAFWKIMPPAKPEPSPAPATPP